MSLLRAWHACICQRHRNELNSLKSFEHLSIGQFVTPSQSITQTNKRTHTHTNFLIPFILLCFIVISAAEQWNGIIGDLVSGSADMSFAPLSVSK